MSTFDTYSSDNKIFDFFMKNTRTFNYILFFSYALFAGLCDRINGTLTIILIILFVFFIILYERYLRRIKANGTLELTKTELNWTSKNDDLKIDKEKIEKIIIVKEWFRSITSQDYKFVLFDIIYKDKTLKHFIVKKSSKDKEEFDIVQSLKVFSSINGIIFDKKKYKFGC